MTDDIAAADRTFTLTVDMLRIQGGGHLHEIGMTINANKLIVDDLGRLVGDTHSIPCVLDEGDGLEGGTVNTGSSGKCIINGLYDICFGDDLHMDMLILNDSVTHLQNFMGVLKSSKIIVMQNLMQCSIENLCYTEIKPYSTG